MRMTHKRIVDLHEHEKKQIFSLFDEQIIKNPYQDLYSLVADEDKSIVLMYEKEELIWYLIYSVLVRKISFLKFKEYGSQWYIIFKKDIEEPKEKFNEFCRYIKRHILRGSFFEYFSVYFWIEYEKLDLGAFIDKRNIFLLDYDTVCIDLSDWYDSRFKNLDKSVRYDIKKSREHGLTFVEEGNFEEFNKILHETYARWWIPLHNLDKLHWNEKIFFAKKWNEYIWTTKIIYSKDICIYFNAGSTSKWLACNSSYFVIDNVVKFCCDRGVRYFDLRWASINTKDVKKTSITRFKKKFGSVMHTPVLQVGSFFFVMMRRLTAFIHQ